VVLKDKRKEKKRESERGRGQVFVSWENWENCEDARCPNIEINHRRVIF